MRESETAIQDAHSAELELQSAQYIVLATELARARAAAEVAGAVTQVLRFS